MDHGVDRARGSKELALERPAVQLHFHGLEEVALGDRADDAGDAGEVLGIALIELDQAVQLGGDLAVGPVRGQRHANGEVALFQLPEDRQNQLGVLRRDAGRLAAVGTVRVGPVGARGGGLVPFDLKVWAPRLATLGHSLLYTKPLRESQTYRATHGDQDRGTSPVTSEA